MSLPKIRKSDKLRQLPTPDAILEARAWLKAGAPTAVGNEQAIINCRELLNLIHYLPELNPIYSYGTPEFKEAWQEFDPNDDV